jgi:hypothetical protein
MNAPAQYPITKTTEGSATAMSDTHIHNQGIRYVITDELLAAHLPNDLMFETCDGEVLASGLLREFAHLTPDQAVELGVFLIRMAAEAARERAGASEPDVLIYAAM